MAKGDTMEINSIIEEARKRQKSGASAPAPKTASRPASSSRPAVSVRNVRSFDDDFVLTDDNGDRVPSSKVKSSAPKKSGSARPQAKKGRKKKTGLIIGVCAAAAVVIGIAVWVIVTQTPGSGTGPDAKIADNVSVNGVSLGGKSYDEARQVLAGMENQLAGEIKIAVKAGDKTFNYTKDNFKYTFNTDDVFNQVKAYSEEKGIKSGQQKYELKLTIDEGSCSEVIGEVAKQSKKEAKNATVTKFDPSSSDMFTVSDEEKGVAVDEQKGLDALKAFIRSGKLSGTVEAPVNTVDPKYTAAFLKSNIKKLSSFQTYSSNNSNGNENMRVSLAACNGSIINPGETWSFNGCTGDSNLESNGYKPAGVIVEGRSETGVGGGICQSSTTIYNAAIRAGMSVVERECHYYKSVYVDAGLDATVDYGNIDLKVSNPFDYQLFMKCWMDDVELNCEIYGLENPKFDSVSISTSDASYFDNGFRVTTSRAYLKDGKEVDSDELPSSTYYFSAPGSGGGSSSGDGGSSGSDSGSSVTDDPSSGAEEPGSSGEEPGTGGEEPGTGGEEPGEGGGETGGEGGEGGGETGGEGGGETGGEGGE